MNIFERKPGSNCDFTGYVGPTSASTINDTVVGAGYVVGIHYFAAPLGVVNYTDPAAGECAVVTIAAAVVGGAIVKIPVSHRVGGECRPCCKACEQQK